MSSTAKKGKLSSGAGWIILIGILMIAVGMIAAINPLATGVASGLLLSVAFILGGGAALAAGFTDSGIGNKLIDFIFGLIAIAAGVIALFNPLVGAVTLAWFSGAMFAFAGVMELIAALRGRGVHWALLLLGIADIVIGAYILFSSPQLALVLLAILVGVGFIVRGLWVLIFGLALRKSNAM